MYTQLTKSLILPMGLIFSLLWIFAYSTAFADAPAMINYQGKLADANGNPRSGTLPMIFRIYDASSGGNLLVSDDRTTNLVPVTNGIFNVLIGSGTIIAGTKTSIAAAIQSTPNTYLQVSISGTNLSPRQRLVATPYALSVAPGSVGSVEVSTVSASKISAGTFQAGNYSFTGSVLTVPAPSNPTDAASKSYVDSQVGGASQWTSNGSSISYSGGYVGVGTTNPQSPFQLIGSNNSGARIEDGFNNRIDLRGHTGGAVLDVYTANSTTPGALSLRAGGNDTMYIDTAGKVGIGTISPTDLFQVENGNIRIHSGGPTLYYDQVGQPLWSTSASGDQWLLKRVNSDMMAVNNAGQLIVHGQLNPTPGSAMPPMILGANAIGQLVTGLNAEQINGHKMTFRRQGASATDWGDVSNAGTNNYTPSTLRIQAGVASTVISTGRSSSYALVTFPVAFSAYPMVFCTPDYYFDGQLIACHIALDGLAPTQRVYVSVQIPSNAGSNLPVAVNWIAIGPE